MRIMKKQIRKRHVKIMHHKKSKLNKKTVIFWVIIAILICTVSCYILFKEKVAATVNGEKILEKRVEAVYNSLPSYSKIPKSQILQQIIDMKILAHYAEKQGYGLSDASFEDKFRKMRFSENKTASQFETEFELWGINKDDFKESIELSIFVPGVLNNNQEAARNIVENERKTAEIQIFKKY